MKKTLFTTRISKSVFLVFCVVFLLLAVCVWRWSIKKVWYYFDQIEVYSISAQAPTPLIENTLKCMEDSGISYELRESEQMGSSGLSIYVLGKDVDNVQNIINEQWVLENIKAGKPAPVLTYDYEDRTQSN